MKVLRFCSKVGLAAIAVFVFAFAMYLSFGETGFLARFKGMDLALRINESLLIHRGIDPFKVWDRTIALADFKGLPRPDKINDERDIPRVHAYVPWHNACTWFYGWVDKLVLRAVFFASYVVIWFLMLWRMLVLARLRAVDRPIVSAAFCCLLLIVPGIQCLDSMNYGFLIAFALWMMIRMLREGHDILAGYCLVIMMFKPQVGILFCWPLFFQRHYRTIVVAAVACFLLSFLPAYALKTSPLELILQILKLGAPYSTSQAAAPLPRAIATLFGGQFVVVWSLLLFAICGVWSWRLKDSRSWFVRLVPASTLFPLWTYSQPHDGVIAWPIIAMVSMAVGNFGRRDYSPGSLLVFLLCGIPSVVIFFMCGTLPRVGLSLVERISGCDASVVIATMDWILRNAHGWILVFGQVMLLLSGVILTRRKSLCGGAEDLV